MKWNKEKWMFWERSWWIIYNNWLSWALCWLMANRPLHSLSYLYDSTSSPRPPSEPRDAILTLTLPLWDILSRIISQAGRASPLDTTRPAWVRESWRTDWWNLVYTGKAPSMVGRRVPWISARSFTVIHREALTPPAHIGNCVPLEEFRQGIGCS